MKSMGMFMGEDGGNNMGQDYWTRDETPEQEELRYKFSSYTDKDLLAIQLDKNIFGLDIQEVKQELQRRNLV